MGTEAIQLPLHKALPSSARIHQRDGEVKLWDLGSGHPTSHQCSGPPKSSPKPLPGAQGGFRAGSLQYQRAALEGSALPCKPAACAPPGHPLPKPPSGAAAVSLDPSPPFPRRTAAGKFCRGCVLIRKCPVLIK